MASKKGQYQLGIEISGKTNRSLKGAVDSAQGDVERLRRKMYASGRDMERAFSKIDTRGLKALDGAADLTFSGMVKSAKAAAAGIGAAVAVSFGYGGSFEKQMSTVQAISQASRSEMDMLNAAAQEMGRTTQFSATEAGQAEEYMAMAGWKAKEMVAGLPGIMNLAAASGEDLASTSDIVTDALTAFGLAAQDSAMFSDVLAQASSSSNTNVSLMGETFKYVAPAAGAMGYSIQDMAVSIGLMANAGIKGSQSGTALRSTITRLAKPTAESGAAMEDLGIEITNADGSMKSWAEVVDQMRTGMQKLTADQKASYAAMLGGQEAMSGLLAIVNASDADYQKLTEAINNSSGAAQRMAEIRIDNLAGDVTLLKSAAEGAGIAMYEGLVDPAREAVQGLTEGVNAFTESQFLEDLVRMAPTARRELKEFGESAAGAFKPLVEAGKWMADHPQVITGTLAGITSAMTAFKAVKAASALPKLLMSVSGVLGAWPVAAAGLAVGGIVGITAAVKTADQHLRKQNLADHFGDISLSIKDLRQISQEMVKTKSLEKMGEAMKAFDGVETLKKSLQDNVDTLEKMNWKVSVGLELSEDDRQSYLDNVESFINGSREQVLEIQYAMQLNLEGLAGKDETGTALKEQFSRFYTDQYEELTRLGDELGQVVGDAFEDGMLDIDEARAIQELQQKMSRITSALAVSEFDANMQVITESYAGNLDAESFQNLQAEMMEQVEASEKKLKESLTYGYAGLNAQLNSGSISQDEYDLQHEYLSGQYQTQLAEVQAKAVSYQVETIKRQYAEELAAVGPELEKETQALLNNTLSWIQGGAFADTEWEAFAGQMGDVWKAAGIDRDTHMAIQELYGPLEASIGRLNELKNTLAESGMEIPSVLTEAISESADLGLIAGNVDAIMEVTADHVAASPEAAEIVRASAEQGGKVPEAVARGIQDPENQAKITDAVKQMEDYTNRMIRGMNIDGKINVNLGASGSRPAAASLERTVLNARAIAHHARGGLIEQPTLSYFAEEGPEMAIPIEDTDHARGLWAQAGKLLGVYQESQGNSYGNYYQEITAGPAAALETGNQGIAGGLVAAFAPVQNFYGDVKKEDVEAANRSSYEEFLEHIDRFLFERRRVAF